jgi:hypothetical protein
MIAIIKLTARINPLTFKLMHTLFSSLQEMGWAADVLRLSVPLPFQISAA